MSPPLPGSCDLVAFYLPQFHPIPENDAWWGKGFTEWTNVVRATPRFRGHYQPHMPSELGFYDLRVPEVRENQAALAAEYGVTAFCYYHYWFNGRRLLERPFDEVLASGKPEFPFLLCWANESWTRAWDGSLTDLLLSQDYSDEDDVRHIRSLFPAFEDARYYRYDGKPMFIVYRSSLLPDMRRTIDTWRSEARRAGLGELYLARVDGHADDITPDPIEQGFDAAVDWIPDFGKMGRPLRWNRAWGLTRRLRLTSRAHGDNRIVPYERVVSKMLSRPAPDYVRHPCVTPSWDNSAPARLVRLHCRWSEPGGVRTLAGNRSPTRSQGKRRIQVGIRQCVERVGGGQSPRTGSAVGTRLPRGDAERADPGRGRRRRESVTRTALLYNPGLHLMGGGERYTFALAEVLLDEGFDVKVAGPTIPSDAELAARGFPSRVPLRGVSPAELSEATEEIDLFIQSTVYPPVRSFAQRSFAVVQFPVGPMRKPFLDSFKKPEDLPWYREHSRDWYREQRANARHYQYIVYSDYVRSWLRRRWHRDSTVLPPAVELGPYQPAVKEPLIVAVARFFPEIHHKRHDVLIEAFRSLSRLAPDWKLVLVGGVDWTADGAREFVADLEAMARDLPVRLHINASQTELRELYERATLFWHAAGFGRGWRQPDQAEHFGISVVEAMSYGAVPLVFDDGGPRTLVQQRVGERWRTIDELVQQTNALIDSPATTAKKAADASAASREFSTAAFAEKARRLLLDS